MANPDYFVYYDEKNKKINVLHRGSLNHGEPIGRAHNYDGDVKFLVQSLFNNAGIDDQGLELVMHPNTT